MRIAVAAAIAALLGCTKKNIRECEGNQNCTAEPGGVCRTFAETGSRWCSYPDSECESGYRWGDVTVGDDLADTCVVEDVVPTVDAVPCDERVSWTADDDIWIGNLDGTEQQNLTQTTDGEEINHEWRPDGRVVTYSRLNDGVSSIWTMNHDGTDPRPVTEGNDVVPRWSPDGEDIVFHRDGIELWRVRADGGGVPMKLSTGPELEFGATFSPDGERIAFVSSADGMSEVWLMNADGTSQAQLTNVSHIDGSGFAGMLAWSPDGARLLFTASQPSDIWVIDADGQNPENLTDGLGQVAAPLWLADGRVLFYHAEDLWIMNQDGTGQSVLIEEAISPSLSADRSRIAFRRGFDVWIANIDGSGETRITTDGADYPQWVGCPE